MDMCSVSHYAHRPTATRPGDIKENGKERGEEGEGGREGRVSGGEIAEEKGKFEHRSRCSCAGQNPQLTVRGVQLFDL